jgi:WD40 repeat protein
MALLWVSLLRAQFYQGTQQEFGKSRVQYQEFLWQYYRFDRVETYFYKGGRDLARYVAISAHRYMGEVEKKLDYTVEDRLQFVVYNSLTDMRQSNIGVTGDEQYNIGGVSRIVGTKIFVYNEGDHTLLDRQVRMGMAQVLLDQMMYGGNWREVLRNNTLLALPEWYTKGLISHVGRPWDAELSSAVRDGIASGRFDKLNRLEGANAELAGHAIWSYVAEVYGTSVIPNILYMTRVSRNAESGFLYVLGVSLKTLQEECLAWYKQRYSDRDRFLSEVGQEEVTVKTHKRRTYSQFKLSPNGRYATWVSNELGQYKVWLYDIAQRSTRRIAKGERRIARIVDTSYPVVAWHPGSQALSWAVERKGETYLRTYTLADRRTTSRPVLLVEKVLDLAYSPDGQRMILSAVREGRTDLYLYYVVGNRQEQLTNDPFDDLHPRFVRNGEWIIFSSDRPDDTLRTVTGTGVSLDASSMAVAQLADRYVAGTKDLFLFDLASRSSTLRRITSTPAVNETQPAAYDSSRFVYLSDEGGLRNRWLAYYDSAISHIDTTVHYRYFSRTQRLTDLRRSLLEHDAAEEGRSSLLQFNNGRYHFFIDRMADGARTDIAVEQQPEDPLPPAPFERTVPLLKVDPQIPRVLPGGVNVENYVFSDDEPGAIKETSAAPTDTTARKEGSAAADSLLTVKLVFPEQRNYNTNFATDQVLTQIDNTFTNQFYQPFLGPANLNPGLSGLTKFAASDLFEDHKVVGGFRLALNLNNNDYALVYENLKYRLDRKIVVQRQAYQLLSEIDVLKVTTHQARYQISWPFSELASARASLIYRHDRFVVQSIDGISLRAPNAFDQWVGAKAEWVFDSSLPRGLNLWTGWKAKVFGEYYQQPDTTGTRMEILGLDLRHSLRVHREIIWVNRIAGSTSLGNRRVAFFLGGADNWLFPKVDGSLPVDPDQNYQYQALAAPMRGFFYNARNGNSFAVFNTEVRVPVFRYFMNRPIRSDLFQTFQVIAFGDVGSAWTGPSPYSKENSFNEQVISRNPLLITIENQREPVVASYGFGLRARLLGYFVRADWGWGVDDGRVLPPVFMFSLNLDI